MRHKRAAGVLLLLIDRTPDVFGVLPYLLILVCPLCICSCMMGGDRDQTFGDPSHALLTA